MVSRRELRVAVATCLVTLPSSIAWRVNLPHATRSVDLPLDGWTPKPTAPPGGLRPFLRRQVNSDASDGSSFGTTALIAPDNTCGFIDGRPGANYNCQPDFSCVFFTASAPLTGNVACCNEQECGARLDCIDYDSYFFSSACNDGCRVDAFTLKCLDSALPYCNTVSFADDIYDFWCNSIDISSAQSATTAYSGQTGRQFEPLQLDPTVTSATLESTSDIPDAPVTEEPTSTASDGQGDDEDEDEDGDEDTPIGAIVGGVVGGVGALALAGLGLWLFFRNKKKKQAAAAAAAAATGASVMTSPTMTYASPPHASSPGNHQQPFQQPTYYDPGKGGAMGAVHGYPPQQYPDNQSQHPGGFHPMGNTPPPPNSGSPTMSYQDGASPSAVYPSGFSVSPQGTEYRGSIGNPGLIHEAPSRPEETQRGGVHEMA